MDWHKIADHEPPVETEILLYSYSCGDDYSSDDFYVGWYALNFRGVEEFITLDGGEFRTIHPTHWAHLTVPRN